MHVFYIADEASAKLVELMKSEESGAKFRISIMGGGCSGFLYNYSFDTSIKQTDHVFSKDGAEVVIDERSMKFLNLAKLLYKSSLGSESFEILNPNTTARCGCGNSFAA